MEIKISEIAKFILLSPVFKEIIKIHKTTDLNEKIDISMFKDNIIKHEELHENINEEFLVKIFRCCDIFDVSLPKKFYEIFIVVYNIDVKLNDVPERYCNLNKICKNRYSDNFIEDINIKNANLSKCKSFFDIIENGRVNYLLLNEIIMFLSMNIENAIIHNLNQIYDIYMVYYHIDNPDNFYNNDYDKCYRIYKLLILYGREELAIKLYPLLKNIDIEYELPHNFLECTNGVTIEELTNLFNKTLYAGNNKFTIFLYNNYALNLSNDVFMFNNSILFDELITTLNKNEFIKLVKDTHDEYRFMSCQFDVDQTDKIFKYLNDYNIDDIWFKETVMSPINMIKSSYFLKFIKNNPDSITWLINDIELSRSNIICSFFHAYIIYNPLFLEEFYNIYADTLNRYIDKCEYNILTIIFKNPNLIENFTAYKNFIKKINKTIKYSSVLIAYERYPVKKTEFNLIIRDLYLNV